MSEPIEPDDAGCADDTDAVLAADESDEEDTPDVIEDAADDTAEDAP
ncbi:MAG TPA: hypothetical protein VE465_02005 [Streptosporangiaceae bacterium]|jgi:hypothetical protein|nr:hypothetical protein [Streptosporangiaceae bacterium]